MRIEQSINFIDRQIAQLEQQTYTFEQVIAPRAEADRSILKEMRNQRVKMLALKEKMERLNKRRAAGEHVTSEEEITNENIRDALPSAFR